MNWPALPFSREAITLCVQMCALYWSVRFMGVIERNVLAATAALLLIGFNIGMIGWTTAEWIRLVGGH